MKLLSAPYWSRERGGYYGEEDYRPRTYRPPRGIISLSPIAATVDALSTGSTRSRRRRRRCSRRGVVGAPPAVRAGRRLLGPTARMDGALVPAAAHFRGALYYIEYASPSSGRSRSGATRCATRQPRWPPIASARIGVDSSAAGAFRSRGASSSPFDSATIGELVELVETELQKLYR